MYILSWRLIGIDIRRIYLGCIWVGPLYWLILYQKASRASIYISIEIVVLYLGFLLISLALYCTC